MLEIIIPSIAILTFIKAIYEYTKSLKWKKSELLTKEVKEFFADERIKTFCQILDWNYREVKIGDDKIIVYDNFLENALTTHDKKRTFTRDESKIRDLFDYFLDRLSYFNFYIKNDLVDEEEVFDYLSYYLDIMTKEGRKTKDVVVAFNVYIDHYNFTNIKELLAKYNLREEFRLL